MNSFYSKTEGKFQEGETITSDKVMWTIRLLRTVGSPFAKETEYPKNSHDSMELYRCAQKNRMTLLYLTALKKWDRLGEFKKTYDDMYEQSLGTYDAISRVSETLNKAHVQYTLFKTIRPYQCTTVDIDIIILKSQREYEKSIKALVNAGYKKLGSGPQSTTVEDPSIDMGVDLYREIAVSQIIYLDKNKIGSYTTERNVLPNREPVRTLSPSADLAALIAHSLIKEHMYTLSEYYSTLYFLAQLDIENIKSFIEIVRENAIVKAAQVHIGITAKLHEVAQGKVPKKIEKITEELGVDYLETRRLENSFETPHKFHPITVMRTMFEKVEREEKTRRSIAKQITSMLNPNFSVTFIKEFLAHVLRGTY